MKLMILSATQSQLLDATSLEVETSVGSFVILENHAPLLLILKANRPLTFYKKDHAQAETMLLPYGGILKVTRTQATVLIQEN